MIINLPEAVNNLLRILIVILVSALAARGVRLLGYKLEKRLGGSPADPERLSRLLSMIQIVRSAIYVLIIISGGLTVLYILDVNVLPLVAGAGILGLVISFGAQALVGDLISGILLLLEDQFRVGDVIRVGDLEGRVERITQRVTYLRNQDGRLHVIPHGAMRILTNLSKGWSLASVDFDVPAAQAEVTTTALNTALGAAASEPGLSQLLLSPPQVVPWVGYKDGQTTIRVTAQVRPGQQNSAAAMLRQHIADTLRTMAK